MQAGMLALQSMSSFSMASQISSNDRSPEILDHDLNRHFPQLLKFESTPEMEVSALYNEIRSKVEKILSAVVCEDLSEPGVVATGLLADGHKRPIPTVPGSDKIAALA